MAFKQVQRIEVSCDGCGEDLMTWEDWTPLYESENEAIENLDQYDWVHGADGKTLCPGCHSPETGVS